MGGVTIVAGDAIPTYARWGIAQLS